MKIVPLKKFDLGVPAQQVRSVPVAMGGGEQAIHFVYSLDGGVDPGEELYRHPTDTLKLALFNMDGEKLWDRDLGWGIIPGIWFCPVLTLDLDEDGVDEIYYLNNLNERAPFSLVYRRLESIDPRTNEVTGSWEWPMNTFDDRLSLCYRFYLVAGRAHGHPVLITSQGTYGDMYLQGYGPGMVKLWDKVIPADQPGPRASHLTPVLDINNDGVDELFWGERLLSVEDGHQVICYDEFAYNGHSDIIIPFISFDTGKRYVFTCREGDERPGIPRVVTFNEDGSHAWDAVDHGHMHFGWLATLGSGGSYRRIVMAMEEVHYYGATHEENGEPVEYYLDAFTGKPAEFDPPFHGSWMIPIDINGDGYSEFFCEQGPLSGWILDQNFEKLAYIGGGQVHNGCILPGFECEQIMVNDGGVISIYGDADAKAGEIFRLRHEYKGYHAFAQRLMASGYNHYRSNISCGI